MPIYPLLGCVRCKQCKATSKRTKQRCRAPAMRNKDVCSAHGGKSTGPRTAAGRQRCAAAKREHGRETRQKRVEYSAKLRELYELELLGRESGVITGPKTRGRKPRSRTNS